MPGAKVSVYGATGSRPIYGSSKRGDPCYCEPEVSPDVGLRAMLALLENLKSVIGKFYPATNIIAPLSAEMAIRGVIPFIILARLFWVDISKEFNDGEKFNIRKQRHRDQLYMIYIQFNHVTDGMWNLDPASKITGDVP